MEKKTVYQIQIDKMKKKMNNETNEKIKSI